MLRSSGPVARGLPLFLIACETISGEKRYTELLSEYSLWSFRLTNRADAGHVTRMTDSEVNCLAKAVAISPLRVRDLEGKVMG